jgi:hypothetical protein
MKYQIGDTVYLSGKSANEIAVYEAKIVEITHYDWDAYIYHAKVSNEVAHLLTYCAGFAGGEEPNTIYLWEDDIIGRKAAFDTREVW